VELHKFSALITLDPSAQGDAVLRYLDGTRTSGILQRGSCRYFPATICWSGSVSPQRVVLAILRIALRAGEAEAFFDAAPGFTVWADAIVGDDTIRGEGLIGDGVLVGQEPADPPGAGDQAGLWPPGQRRLPYRRNNPAAGAGRGATALAVRR
jgi:hypothetical protein